MSAVHRISSETQLLTKGLGVAVGEALFGVTGPFLFGRFGLNIPQSAALGAVIGAVVGYGVADAFYRLRQGTYPVSHVPEITKPAVSTGNYDFAAIEPSGTLASDLRKESIQEALARLSQKRPVRIQVEVRDRKVVLKGEVHSWVEEAEAERIAFDTPGIEEVENRIEVVR